MIDNIFKSPHGQTVHLCGIGGVSMRALAKLLLTRGFDVQGSDRDESKYTDELKNMGARITIGHKAEAVHGASVIVRTAAVKDDNPEIVEAFRMNIPVYERAEAWGMIMREYGTAVCVAGTHGKTSTTAMISSMLTYAGMDPTVMVGGDMPSFGGSLRIGSNDLMVAEACEYMNSFLHFCPTIAVILNIESDHIDFFKDINTIISSFRRFAESVPEEGGLVLVNHDNLSAMAAVKDIGRKVYTFGESEDADIYADNILCEYGFYSFDIYFKGEHYSRVKLSVPGEHNLMNTLAAAGTAIAKGIPGNVFAEGIAEYKGISRRFEYKGEYNGARLFDDYAHHPSEITATLKTVREMDPKRLICIFQPHTFTRTSFFIDDFARSLGEADICLMAEIFAAREKNESGITSEMVCRKIPGSIYMSSFDDIVAYIRDNAQEGDYILTIGAGDIYKIWNRF